MSTQHKHFTQAQAAHLTSELIFPQNLSRKCSRYFQVIDAKLLHDTGRSTTNKLGAKCHIMLFYQPTWACNNCTHARKLKPLNDTSCFTEKKMSGWIRLPHVFEKFHHLRELQGLSAKCILKELSETTTWGRDNHNYLRNDNLRLPPHLIRAAESSLIDCLLLNCKFWGTTVDSKVYLEN